MPLLDRRLLFVTGKGGVGKTSVASAIGLLAAQRGKRTLVCESDAKGNLADFFGVGPLAFEPTEIRKRLFAMSMDTEESLKEYLRLQVKVPMLARIGPLAHTFDFVANAAPGVKEILTVGKFTWEVREDHYDLVVVDASATGHVVGQLAAPVAINDLVKVGVVRNQTDWMIDILTDPAQTGVVIVTVPEEMPVSETLELIARLDAETEHRRRLHRHEPGAARAVQPQRGGDLRPPRRTGRSEGAGRPRGRRRRRCDVGCRTGGDAPTQPGAPPQPAA